MERSMSYIPRTLSAELDLALAQYPVVTLLGPRQSGKTTFVQNERPRFFYANLEDPELRAFASKDPKGFFAAYGRPLVLDEIQQVPQLLSYIQVEVDREGQNGAFILTGSHQLKLGQAIAQSLAGRTAILTLLPLSFQELGAAAAAEAKNESLFKGFLPRVRGKGQEPNRAYANYFRTYVERDLHRGPGRRFLQDDPGLGFHPGCLRPQLPP
jgi:predicted AAA+ superfamily ATPase